MARILLIVGIFILPMACRKEFAPSFETRRTLSTKICAVKSLAPVGLEQIYGCTNTLYALRTAFADSFRVVRNQAAFDSLLSGGCNPAVDFGQYDLLAGPRQFISGIDSVSYSLQHNCPEKRYEVSIRFHRNLSMMAPRVTWHLLLPKLKAGETVQVSFQ